MRRESREAPPRCFWKANRVKTQDTPSHVRSFLGLPGTTDEPGRRGRLITDDFGGYKATFALGMTKVGGMAPARGKFHDLWANHGSAVGDQALKCFGVLYNVEREVAGADGPTRLEARRRSRPVADALMHYTSGFASNG